MVETRRPALERYWLLIVVLAVVVVYGSLVNAPYLIWDDDLNIFENPYYQTGRWGALWTAPYFGLYIPVTSMVWAALFTAGGGQVWPFRLLNLALHLGNVLLLASLLRGRFRQWNAASGAAMAIGVAIFALHPMQVAAVSWLSGGRDLLATFFALAALRAHRSGSRWRIAWSTVLFTCALLSKPSVVTIPLVLVVLTFWFDRERLRSAIWTAAGWTAMAIVSVLITRQAQAGMFSQQVPVAHRPLIALDAIGFYLMKIVWPWPLAADYGRRPDVVWATPSMMIPTIAVAVAAIVVGVVGARRDPRYRIALVWLIMMLPVLGLIPFAYQRISTVADHYGYMALGTIASVAAIFVSRRASLNGRLGWGIFGAVVIIYGGASLARTTVWRNNQVFFEDMTRRNPRSFSAVINIASTQCEKGNWQVGLATIQQTALLAHTDAAFLANETFCLFKGKRFDDALARQSRLKEPAVVASLDSNPEASAVLASSFAGAFLALDRPLPAFAYLCQAAAVEPQDLDIARNVATAKEDLRRRGREVACRGKIRWDNLADIVKVLD